MILKIAYVIFFIMRAWDIDIDTDFSGILLDKKLYKEKHENISIHDISYRTSTGAKALGIRYNKTDRFIKIQNKIRCLVLFDEWRDKIYYRIEYLVNKKKWH